MTPAARDPAAGRDPAEDVDAPAEVCVACRFGTGEHRDCTLILAADLSVLLAEGPCRLPDVIADRVERWLRRHFPLSAGHAEDAAQEILLRLMERRDAFPGGDIRSLPRLQRWLNHFARNGIIDHLRRARVIPKLRCGACVHFASEPSPRCRLEWLPEAGARPARNPHFGDGVEHGTNPRRLDPPCETFEWRRPGTFDPFEGEILARGTGSPGDETAKIVILALDRLAAMDRDGVRIASAIERFYLRGDDVPSIAAAAGVSERTVKRLLAAGRERLLMVLRRDFAVVRLEDLL